MVSVAAEWQAGKELWYVMHDSEDGMTSLDSTGQTPAALAGLHGAALAEQVSDDVDYMFDVPILLAQHVTGYRHDESFEDG